MSTCAYTFCTHTVRRRKPKLLSVAHRSSETSSGHQGSNQPSPLADTAHLPVPPSRRPVSCWSCCFLCWQMTFFKTPLSHHLLQEVSLGPKAA